MQELKEKGWNKKLKLDNIFNFIIIGGSMMGSIIQKEQVENKISENTVFNNI